MSTRRRRPVAMVLAWVVAGALTVVTAWSGPDVWDLQVQNDNGPATGNELVHGSDQVHDLAARPGPVADEDWFRISQRPFTSHEVVVDAASGDLGTGNGPSLQRVTSGGALLQDSQPVGGGRARSLRWVNATALDVTNEFVRVRSASCTTTCGPDDSYRIRAYETTGSVARFSNAGSQVTVLILQNPGDSPIAGTTNFWNGTGQLLSTRPLSLPARQTSTFNTATDGALAGQAGSITIATDAPFGGLAGKAVAVEPATGFSFDSPVVLRLDAGAPVRRVPPKPAITSTNPPSGFSASTVQVLGVAESGTLVRLYQQSNCAGNVDAVGSAAQFASPGLTVNVTPPAARTFYAQATDAGGNVSACSVGFPYTNAAVCFAAGTLVHTVEGLRPIEQVRPGDRVPSYGETTGLVTESTVVAVQQRTARDLLGLEMDGERIVATGDHPFFVAGAGWVRARDLRAGEALKTQAGAAAPVHPVPLAAASAGEQVVYNLVVEGKTYFVGRRGALVHSCDTTLEVTDRVERAPLPSAAAAPASGPALLLFNAAVGGFTVWTDPGTPSSALHPLPCPAVEPWALRIGTHDGFLVVLDAKDRAIKLIDLEAVRAVAAGRSSCAAAADRMVRRVGLHGEGEPYAALLDGDRVYVSYFLANRVDMYRWSGERVPDLRFAASLAVPTASGMGVSGLATVGETLFVADSGWACPGNACPTLFGDSSVLAVDRDVTGPPRALESRPADRNTVGFYRHEATGALYVLNAGVRDGRSSLQRLGPQGSIGPPLALPLRAQAFKAFPLTRDFFAVLQLAGGHVFLVDAREDRLAGVFRYDGRAFVPLPMPVAALDERSEADLQDIVRDPTRPGHFHFVDAKNEQVVDAVFDAGTASWTVASATPVGSGRARRIPSWALWLDRGVAPALAAPGRERSGSRPD